MTQIINNDAMWAAFRQELTLQDEISVAAAIDNALNNLGVTINGNDISILESSKQGEQDTYWSEDDEKTIHLACEFIRHHSRRGDSISGIDCIELVKRLKSIKDRYAWKPSDEQMRPLEYAIDYFKKKKNDTTYLESLYQDLKKLREE